MATPLLMSTNEPTSTRSNEDRPNSRPDQNPPKTRGRKGGKSSQNGPSGPKKQPQRGMGVAQLERLLGRQQQQLQPYHHHVNPLAGVPVQPGGLARYGFPVHSAHQGGPAHNDDPRSAFRVVGGPIDELPSIPNFDHSFKKKRVIGDDVGFILPHNGSNFSGSDLNNGDKYNPHYLAINGGFSGYCAGSEVVAIHTKENGSRMVMMEYGFFPSKSEANEGEKYIINNIDSSRSSSITTYDSNNNNNNNNYNDNNNYYYKMEDLNLKMGFSDPSLSPSSSLSSEAAPCSNSLDLSLKLSY